MARQYLGYTATPANANLDALWQRGVNVNANDYGAKGDGVTDDTAAIQAALNAGAGSGLVVVIPPTAAFYKVTAQLNISSHTTIYGYGATLKNTTTTPFIMLLAEGASGALKTDVSVFGLTVDCNGTVLNVLGSGIGAHYCNNFRVQDCTVKNSWLQGIFLGVAGENCWIQNNLVTRAWGDGIHIGDQYSGESLQYIYVTNNVVLDCWDDGIGVTGSAHNVWVCDNVVDRVTQAAGIDLSGCYNVVCARNYVANYGQIGIRLVRFNASIVYNVHVLDNIIGPPPANQAAINLYGPNNTTDATKKTVPIVVRGNTITGVTAANTYAVFVTGAGAVTIEDNHFEGTTNGVTLSGLTATALVGPVEDCRISNNRFRGFATAIALSSGNNDFRTSGNTFIGCTNLIPTPSGAYVQQAALWEADAKRETAMFRAVTFTRTALPQAEVDTSARVSVFANQRVQLFYLAEDVSGPGLGSTTVELYDVTGAAVLATATITGNTSPYAWRSLSQVLIPTDTTVTVRYGRDFAGGSVSIKAAVLRVG